MQNRSARKQNREIWSKSSNPLQGKRWTVRAFLDGMSQIVKEQGVMVPSSLRGKVPEGAIALFGRMYEVAIRDNSENPRIYCPECKRWHTVEASAPCPEHPETQPDIPVRVENAMLERNSVAVGLKIMDKMLPTLASVSQKIDIEGKVTTVSVEIAKVIFEYVPAEKRKACLERIDNIIQSVQTEDRD